jgi:hypothetical protein
MFAASKTDGSAVAPDAQFNYVTMLLHGDGTNGAQNNTFVDSSTNNFTITRNGNTTQGSFSPYGSGWSNVFDGSISSAYLSVATNTAFNCGTGNFTVEAWVNITAYTGSYPLIIGNNNGGFSAGAIALTSQNATSGGASKISFTAYDINSSGVTLAAASTNTIGGWTHFAVVRNGTSLVLYINGASSASTTISAGVSLDFGKNGLLIGGGNWDTANGYYAGYISNLRLVKGTAVYTSAFTPSTTPLTAISGTSLLTCQSNRFIDNSANNFTVTANSPSRVERFNPFGTATAYSTSVIGGSGYFDGSDDLTFPNNTAFAFGTGSFTIEFWINGPLNNDKFILGGRDAIGGMHITTGGSSSTAGVLRYVGTSTIVSSNVITDNTWHHCAIVRNGSSNITLYVDGVSVGTGTDTNNYAAASGTWYIARNDLGASNFLTGYLSDLRIVKGTAVYTSAFTPPSAPVTAITNTSLLLNYTNGAIFDNAMMNDLETVGNAQISTSVVKYGTGSMYFDGTGDWLSILNTRTSTPSGVESWTIEGWIYPTTIAGGFKVIYTNGYPIQIYLSSGSVEIYISSSAGSGSYIISAVGGPASSVSANVWSHFAVVKNGNTYTVYVNGVGGTSGTSATAIAFPSATNATIGDGPVFGSYPYTGYIDDFRITKGYARYTANFTPPTAALSDTGPI